MSRAQIPRTNNIRSHRLFSYTPPLLQNETFGTQLCHSLSSAAKVQHSSLTGSSKSSSSIDQPLRSDHPGTTNRKYYMVPTMDSTMNWSVWGSGVDWTYPVQYESIAAEESDILPGFWGQLANILAGRDAMTPRSSNSAPDDASSASMAGFSEIDDTPKRSLVMTDTWNCSPWGTGRGWMWIDNAELRKREKHAQLSCWRGLRTWVTKVWNCTDVK